MLDFTSALYLGLHHSSRNLMPWQSFTTGVPVVLLETKKNVQAGKFIAKLQGAEDAVLAPSTLHIFTDLFELFGDEELVIYVDEGVYPIAQWGIMNAQMRGAKIIYFPHYDSDALEQIIRKYSYKNKRAIIVSDSINPSVGKPAPITDYILIAKDLKGYLVLDDTQALGILGYSRTKKNPYGFGGGGILQWTKNVMSSNVLVVSSMAKAFGVPLASFSSSRKIIQKYKDKSVTRVYCSPPSNVAVIAALNAVSINQKCGDQIRKYLLKLIYHFRHILATAGFRLHGGYFPVQTLNAGSSDITINTHKHLKNLGINSVLHQDRITKAILISFLINATQKLNDIENLAATLIKLMK